MFRWGVILSFIFLTVILSTPTEAVGVRPLVQDLYVRPGDTAPFEIVFSSSGIQETVHLTVYEPRQMLDGSLGYVLGDATEFPPMRWISLERQRVVVRPGEDVRVPGQVHVPFDAGGSYIVVVMVEPEVEIGAGVTIRVRYAVRLQIHVERAGLRPAVELIDFNLVADEENAPVLLMHVRNPSRLLYDVSGEVTIRDDARQLVERVTMHTEYSAQMERDETPIYPGAEVVFVGDLKEPLYPGDYELRLFMRYADGRQIVQTRQITLTGDEFDQTERMRPVAVEPERITLQLRPGGVATVPLQLRNRTGQSLDVSVGAREISADYAHSVFETIEMQSRGETELAIDARRSGRTVLIMRAPRDVTSGGYYGYIDVGVFDGEGYVDTVSVPVEIVVPGPWEPRAQALDVTYEPGDGATTFSVYVRNLSDVHFPPSGVIYLNNERGVAVRTLFLELEEDVPHILPDRTGYLVGFIADLEPGEYTASIHVQYDQQDLDVVQFPVFIEATGGNEP